MKKTKILYAAGTLVLAVSGLLVTRANKKFKQFNSARVNFLSSITINAANHFTDVANANARTAFFATRHGFFTNLYTCVTTSLSTHKLYYK